MRESVFYQSIRQEGLQEGRSAGIKEGKKEGIDKTILAFNLLKTGVSDEQIVNDTGLSLEQVQQIRSQLNS